MFFKVVNFQLYCQYDSQYIVNDLLKKVEQIMCGRLIRKNNWGCLSKTFPALVLIQDKKTYNNVLYKIKTKGNSIYVFTSAYQNCSIEKILQYSLGK